MRRINTQWKLDNIQARIDQKQNEIKVLEQLIVNAKNDLRRLEVQKAKEEKSQ